MNHLTYSFYLHFISSLTHNSYPERERESTRSFFLHLTDCRPLCTLHLPMKVTSSSSLFLLSFFSSSPLLLFHFVRALLLHLSQTKHLTNQGQIRHCMYPIQCLPSRPTPETSASAFGLVTIYFSCLISTNYGNGRYNICMCIWIV